MNTSSSIRFFNTFSGKIEPFETFNQGVVNLYVCGVTPYDTSHLGHAFVFIIFDMLVRFLKYKGYNVIYTQNVTDIDDPLIEKAKQLNTTWEELAEKWTSYLLNDFKFLNINLPTHYVKATQELPKMIEIINVLIEKEHAYTKDGNVYFSIKSFPSYGQLSKLDRDTMIKISSERGNDIHDKNKSDPLDFLLWKKSSKDEPSWESPWSQGRPGWHIECTAMSMNYLGQQIDIHGGGTDLIFPHHESEIAQAEGYTDKVPFVKTWMHCAMVAYQGEKMSKSLGNLVYVQDLAKNYSANAIRYFLLEHHYRNDWEFKDENMKVAAEKIATIEAALKDVPNMQCDISRCIDIIGEDLNIPEALKMLSDNNVSSQEKRALFTFLGFTI